MYKLKRIYIALSILMLSAHTASLASDSLTAPRWLIFGAGTAFDVDHYDWYLKDKGIDWQPLNANAQACLPKNCIVANFNNARELDDRLNDRHL